VKEDSHIIHVYPDDLTRKYTAGMLGHDALIACHSEELPQKLGNILRAIRGI
jgi:hypothetical protein